MELFIDNQKENERVLFFILLKSFLNMCNVSVAYEIQHFDLV